MQLFKKKEETQRIVVLVVREGEGSLKAEFEGNKQVIDMFVRELEGKFSDLESQLRRAEKK